jgi:V8-like Glu-specific endopeptidase
MKNIKNLFLSIILLFSFVNISANADTSAIIPSNVQNEKVILDDSRTKITNATAFPYNTIVYIEMIFPNGNRYSGSGTIIAPNVVLTAGHCVYSKNEGGYAKIITIYRSQANGNYNPSLSYTANSFLVNPDFIANTVSDNDLGLIYLNENVGLTTGWMSLSSDIGVGQNVNVVGFPGDHQKEMWGTSGKIQNVNTNTIDYDIDTAG